MSIKIVPGDILDVKEGIIVHQVNCQRVMGAGLAKAIREKYPEHYNEYRMTKPILGNAIFTDVGDGLTVAAIYGQDRYGYGDVFTDYAALEKGLKKVQAFSEQTGRQIYIPFGIGVRPCRWRLGLGNSHSCRYSAGRYNRPKKQIRYYRGR